MTDQDGDSNNTEPTAAVNKKTKSIHDTYWIAATNGLSSFLVGIRSAWHGDDGQHYYYEKGLLQKYVSPLYWGCGITCFLFLNFRVTGSQRFKQLRSSWLERRKLSAKSAAPAKTKKPALVEEPVGYLEKQRLKREKEALSSIKFLTDLLVSLSVGTSSTLFLLDAVHKTMRADLENSPLVPGRSLVASTACQELLPIADKFPITGASFDDETNLHSLYRFAKHCQLRRDRESQIRNITGKLPTDDVDIPYPGVERK